MSIKERAAALLAAPDVTAQVEQLLRNQVYIDEKELREAIKRLGFDVSGIGDGWGISFPARDSAYRYRWMNDETATEALKKMAALLRKAADELEALLG